MTSKPPSMPCSRDISLLVAPLYAVYDGMAFVYRVPKRTLPVARDFDMHVSMYSRMSTISVSDFVSITETLGRSISGSHSVP